MREREEVAGAKKRRWRTENDERQEWGVNGKDRSRREENNNKGGAGRGYGMSFTSFCIPCRMCWGMGCKRGGSV